jgi:hypothetical protein
VKDLVLPESSQVTIQSLKAKIVQILFSQMHQNYAKYTFETFTVDGITIAYQIKSMAGVRMFSICIILVKTLRKSEHIFKKNLRNTLISAFKLQHSYRDNI